MGFFGRVRDGLDNTRTYLNLKTNEHGGSELKSDLDVMLERVSHSGSPFPRPPFPMPPTAGGVITEALVEYILDQKKPQEVEPPKMPEIGAVIFCDLFAGATGHSGIYVGSNRVVELTRDGIVREVNLRTFTNNPSTVKKTIYFPAAIDEPRALGKITWSNNALSKRGQDIGYCFSSNNCHRFCAGAITELWGTEVSFLTDLLNLFEEKIGEAVRWVPWDWQNS